MSTLPAKPAHQASGTKLDRAIVASVLATGSMAIFVFAQQLQAIPALAVAGNAIGINLA